MFSVEKMFLVGMFASTFHPPRCRVKVQSLRQPKLADVLWTRRNPGESLTVTVMLLTGHILDSPSWQ